MQVSSVFKALWTDLRMLGAKWLAAGLKHAGFVAAVSSEVIRYS